MLMHSQASYKASTKRKKKDLDKTELHWAGLTEAH